MTGSKLFSGPPSNKATASTLATAVTTLFWTIAAHTFWKTMTTADMTLYISTSAILLTAIVGFAIPESAHYTQHNVQRLAAHAAARDSMANSPAIGSAISALEARIQGMQDLQNTIANRLGATSMPAIPTSGQ
jgi:hypothetical protein